MFLCSGTQNFTACLSEILEMTWILSKQLLGKFKRFSYTYNYFTSASVCLQFRGAFGEKKL